MPNISNLIDRISEKISNNASDIATNRDTIGTNANNIKNVLDISKGHLSLSGGNLTGPLTINNQKVATEDFVTESINNIDLGGGLEVGDIALAPLGIDETDNCRRYLNGQVILQSQFVAFTEKLKHAITLYPNLATTEQNWQSAVTLSPLGQCGKFVIDDEAGTIRLPKVVNVMGALDLSTIGQTVEAGLPNITGDIEAVSANGTHAIFATASNAFSVSGDKRSTVASTVASTSDKTRNTYVDFNASRSSSIYGNSTTVQQEAIKYPYFIQVATSNNEDVQIDTQVRLNNPFSLFMPYWSPIELNNLSWLRSNKQWNNGSVYTSAYEFLLEKYNAGVETTETIAGVSVTYRLADNGMKIITDKSVYDALISASGSAWFFVLDTANTQFILPYTTGFMQFGNELGKFTEAGLPNITGSIGIPWAWNDGGTILENPEGVFYNLTGHHGFLASLQSILTDQRNLSVDAIWFDASKSNPIYSKSPTVQPNSITGHLYFYVGEVEKDANIIATSGLAESISRKLDIQGASRVGMPSDRYVDLSVGATGTTYTAPADGFFYCAGSNTAEYGVVSFTNTNTGISDWRQPTVSASLACSLTSTVRKGDTVVLYHNMFGFNTFRFIYAEGAK